MDGRRRDRGDRPVVERLVTVASCTSRIEAQLKRTALEAHGVRAVVLTDDAGGIHPQLAMLACSAVRLAVPDHEADTARDLLAELDAGLHALPSTGEHERIDAPHASTGLAWAAGILLGVLVVYRVVTLVIPGMG